MELITGKYSIKQIFSDHWDNFQKQHANLPDYINDTIQKMLACRDTEKLGFHKYLCLDHPDQYIIIPHSCKSRFCTTCAKILTDIWIAKINSIFPNTSFHHIVFTIPDSLRELFNKNRFLLHCLFHASSQTMLSWAKKKHFLPAIICVIHSFGNDGKFNPHIHMLITAGGIYLKNNKQNQWKEYLAFPFNMMRKKWPVLLINKLKNDIQKYLKQCTYHGELASFSHIPVMDAFFKPFYYLNWYVHDSKDLPQENFNVAYIGRYTKRPPLAQKRILNYNGKFVSYSYKERNAPPVIRTVPVNRFIAILIQHILPPNFHQIRHYGALANCRRASFKNILAKFKKKFKQTITLLSWRQRQAALTGKDPLLCPICKKLMALVEFAVFSKKHSCLIYHYPP